MIGGSKLISDNDYLMKKLLKSYFNHPNLPEAKILSDENKQ